MWSGEVPSPAVVHQVRTQMDIAPHTPPSSGAGPPFTRTLCSFFSRSPLLSACCCPPKWVCRWCSGDVALRLMHCSRLAWLQHTPQANVCHSDTVLPVCSTNRQWPSSDHAKSSHQVAECACMPGGQVDVTIQSRPSTSLPPQACHCATTP